MRESLKVDSKTFHYKQIEGGFTPAQWRGQPKMLAFARSCAKEVNPKGQHDLVELYCGNGNFPWPLADCFRHVLATEISKPRCKAAQDNIRDNGINNLIIARLSSEEFCWRCAKARV